MFINREWKDYKIVATGDGEKLERWGGEHYLIRPDPQVIWKPSQQPLRAYKDISAIYESTGWNYIQSVPEYFTVSWRDLNFKLKLMKDFKHTGLFPEQAANWERMIKVITRAKDKNPGRTVKVLNLFAYTGGATVACLSAGAEVTHVDASRPMVERASENVRISGLNGEFCRYIIDDCMKFVTREIRRGNKYDIIIMDPPSFGRGPSGEKWKIEDNLFDLVCATSAILSDDPICYLINSYTTGLQPIVMTNLMKRGLAGRTGEYDADEIALPTEEGDGIFLPAGAAAWLYFVK
ncbi:MAG: class I SAM-dependent methyltransferase [Clostridiaceae bacterium]|jgi:23S rRNA (cytosine1962-C5)-methyltransferase|nr:class I SAM-dependent methyltransferase [Clostridiaceae bacterium]